MVKNLSHEKALAWERRKWALKKLTFDGNLIKFEQMMLNILGSRQVRTGHRLPDIQYVAQTA